jgi:hypothetical protein
MIFLVTNAAIDGVKKGVQMRSCSAVVRNITGISNGRQSRESGNPFCSDAKSEDGFPLSRE